MRKGILAAALTASLLFSGAHPVMAEAGPVTYGSIYAGAFSEAEGRHSSYVSGGITDSNYSGYGYALADITGDGVAELLFRQTLSKHACEIWAYGYNGTSSYYMGNFECDADSDCMYGYRSGVLYRESYKGSVSLYAAEWNGSGFSVTQLYDGTYPREEEPPTIHEAPLSGCYDASRLLGQIPEFIAIESGSAGYAAAPTPAAPAAAPASDPRDLSNFDYRTVITDNSKGALVFETGPDSGEFMNAYQFWNGDRIYVNVNWRENGYAIAYSNGTYGYVDADYVNWGSGSLSGFDDRFNLSNFGYRAVQTTDTRGALVFQTEPNGSFLYDYQYWNGDDVYVNLYWRSGKYAIAYQDGVYGYVDSTYIDWVGPTSDYDGRFDLSNYAYRPVITTDTRGALVFQTAPNGSFLYDYQYWNGDDIYVNLDWREGKYAIAYSNGTYGYVDATYISW